MGTGGDDISVVWSSDQYDDGNQDEVFNITYDQNSLHSPFEATGTAGRDYLTGGDFADTLDGAAGDDHLDGGDGSDVLTGGAGVDFFVFQVDEADGDVITDFDGNGAGPGDFIQLEGYTGGSVTVNHVGGSDYEFVVDHAGGSETIYITLAPGADPIDPSDYTFI